MISRRRFLRSSGVALGTVALAGNATAAETDDRPEGFVKTDGAQFSLDGEPYYFGGTNNFWLMDNYETKKNVRKLFNQAAALDTNVVRTWAFNAGRDRRSLQPTKGEYNEAAFEHLDYVVDQAGKHGIRLILPLTNNWSAYGGMPQYVEWSDTAETHDDFYTDDETQRMYREYVEKLLTRENTYSGVEYRNDPTVFMWELANEPRAREKGTDVLTEWIRDASAYIKSLDDNHLVSAGMEGQYDLPGRDDYLHSGYDGVSYLDQNAVETVDACSFHLYPSHWGIPASQGTKWIRDHVRDGHQALEKPAYLGEFGIKVDRSADNADAQLARRNRIYESWYDALDATDADGGLVWQLALPTHAQYTDGFYVYSDDDRTTKLMKQYANRTPAIARANPDTTDATVGKRVAFGVADQTENGSLTALDWDLGDDTTASGWYTAHRYDSPGRYTVALTATNQNGDSTTHEVTIPVADLTEPIARIRPSTTETTTGERVTFGAKDTSGGDRWIESLDWNFGDGTTASGWWNAHEYDSAGTYTVELTATDNTGHSTTDSVDMTVQP
jgi:mannan endo-1,4-beta-mannosidase